MTRKGPPMQVSSGGVVYRASEGGPEIVLIETAGEDSRWTLPKGHVEHGESLVDTAAREVGEETGLEAHVLRMLGEIQYTFYSAREKGRVLKTVHFFLMTRQSGSLTAPCPKIARAEWVPLEEAYKRVHYDTEREILDKAREAIEHVEHLAETDREHHG